MNYTVGIEVDNLTNIDISSEELLNSKDDSVLIFLGTESNGRLYEYYANIRELLVRGNRVILLMNSKESKIRTQICMLLVTYKNYDIYDIADRSLITFDYVMSLLDRQPTFEEVETFIGSDISLYDKLNELLAQMTDLIHADKYDEVTKLIVENISSLEDTINVVDYLKNVADTSQLGFHTTVTKLKEEVSALEADVNNKETLLDAKKYQLQQLQTELEASKHDVAKYKQQIDKLTDSSGITQLLSYTTLNLNVTKSKTGAIIYFKEIGKLRYINTFITSLVTILQKKFKLSTKLLIYDNNTNFNIYKPLSYVDSRSYRENKDLFISKDKNDRMVIVEPASNILSDILKVGFDVVIIYDRLRGTDDLISGAQVYKYYVVSSKHEYEMLKNSNKAIPDEEVIGHPYISSDIIGIGELRREDLTTPSKITSAYYSMANTGRNKECIMMAMLNRINAQSLRH